MSQSSRGRGRPAVYVGKLRKSIVSVIRKSGNNLSHAQVALADSGTTISMPTLRKLASEAGVKVRRGRPALAA